jgi:hypothetical protein
LRDLQESTSWLLIDAALEHSSLIPRESFVDGHCASVPRMPRIKDFSRFNIMGVALSSCTTRSATTRVKENLILLPLLTEGARNRKAAVRCRERLGGLLKYY